MRVRLDNIDHALARPGPLDESSLPKVPVIRIYGLSSTGQRACLHVHQVYPYFFVNYYGSLNPDKVKSYIQKLTKSLNHAIALSLHRNPHGPNAQYIRAIIIVKGVPFYGFHTSHQPFLKILVADPKYVSRTVTILQSGGIMRTRFTTYESHLSYYLQFMCDFSLYGCGWVDLGEVFLRGDNQDPSDIPGSESLPTSPYFKQSPLSLEFDVCSHQILNRNDLESRDIHSSLRIPAASLPPEPLIRSVRELWEDERRRRIAKGLSASPDMPKLLSEHSRSKGGQWVDLDRLQNILFNKCSQEETEGRTYHERNRSWERWVMSTFESVEALWGSERRTWRPKRDDNDGLEKSTISKLENWSVMTADDGESNVAELDVDESMVSSQEINMLVRDEEQQTGLRDRDDEDEAEDDEVGVDPSTEEGLPPELQLSESSGTAQTGPQNFQYDIHDATGRAGQELMSSSFFEQTSHVNDDERQSIQLQNNKSPALDKKVYPAYPNTTSPALTQPWLAPVLDERLDTAVLDDPRTGTTFTVDHGLEFAKSEIGTFLASSSFRTESLQDGDQPPAKRRKLEQRSTSGSFIELNNGMSSQQASHSDLRLCTRGFVYARPPPRANVLLDSLPAHGILHNEYRSPFYSVSEDLPERPREYAGLIFDLTQGSGTTFLPSWVGDGGTTKMEPLYLESICGWEYGSWPPSRRRIAAWLKNEQQLKFDKERGDGHDEKKPKRKPHIDGQTQSNIYGFKSTPYDQLESTRERQNMSILSLEVFAKFSGQKVPNPNEDEIIALFYSFQNEHMAEHSVAACKTGVVIVESEHFDARMTPHSAEISIVSSELDLINGIIDKVLELDPDIVAGWEVQAASWGYLEARGRTFGLDVSDAIGRAPTRQFGGSDQWGMRTTSTFKVAGRHVLNVWRLMRVELSLNMYSFENVAFQLLNRRVPKYSAATLTQWFNSYVPAQTVHVLRYFISRSRMLLEMLDAAEVITKTAEFARVFGVDFFSVISRGSQFKVESFMFRIAKPESFVFISPSKSDVGKQNAAECMPLIMEPYSAFYKGPVVVLDFQSLYPSVMIAYNYCYSTCLGRIQKFKGKNKFGVVHNLETPPGLLNTLKEHLTISPNGMVFVKPEVRKGLLGKMLIELLDTRVMVKQAMKGVRDQKALMRVLEARQLGLKYIANVTYGYASATFSGRMPAVEIADAIVQSGRETLEKAIELIESTSKWGAKVVYGDTDSLFIYLHGRTKEQAFLIGNEMADAVTAQNPAPIKLKFEKVFLPSVLMAKKRYVGFKYERPDDEKPAFDAKGIETIRRDGIPAQQKMVERCLKILFRSQDLSAIKEYCQKSWRQILEGSVSTQEFIFAKEVRLGTYSDKQPPPPGAAVAARRMVQDANDEPQYRERVPYVITRGEPGMKLVERAVSPEELLHNSNKRIDAEYYISRVLIPPLERIFNLIGADVRSWYYVMMKGPVSDNTEAVLASPEKPGAEDVFRGEDMKEEERAGIDSHYRSSQCALCRTSTDEVVCRSCRRNPQESLHALQGRLQEAELRLVATHAVCVSCTGSSQAEGIKCESLDCAWLYARDKAEEDLDALQGVTQLTGDIENLAIEEANRMFPSMGHSDSGSDCTDPSASDYNVFL